MPSFLTASMQSSGIRSLSAASKSRRRSGGDHQSQAAGLAGQAIGKAERHPSPNGRTFLPAHPAAVLVRRSGPRPREGTRTWTEGRMSRWTPVAGGKERSRTREAEAVHGPRLWEEPPPRQTGRRAQRLPATRGRESARYAGLELRPRLPPRPAGDLAQLRCLYRPCLAGGHACPALGALRPHLSSLVAGDRILVFAVSSSPEVACGRFKAHAATSCTALQSRR